MRSIAVNLWPVGASDLTNLWTWGTVQEEWLFRWQIWRYKIFGAVTSVFFVVQCTDSTWSSVRILVVQCPDSCPSVLSVYPDTHLSHLLFGQTLIRLTYFLVH